MLVYHNVVTALPPCVRVCRGGCVWVCVRVVYVCLRVSICAHFQCNKHSKFYILILVIHV